VGYRSVGNGGLDDLGSNTDEIKWCGWAVLNSVESPLFAVRSTSLHFQTLSASKYLSFSLTILIPFLNSDLFHIFYKSQSATDSPSYWLENPACQIAFSLFVIPYSILSCAFDHLCQLHMKSCLTMTNASILINPTCQYLGCILGYSQYLGHVPLYGGFVASHRLVYTIILA